MNYYAGCMFYILYLSCISIADKPCIQRKYNLNSYVCVCNSTYCDEIDEIKPLPRGKYMAFTSSMTGLRFSKTTDYINKSSTMPLTKQSDMRILLAFILTSKLGNVIMQVNRKQQFQKIVGFGGSATDTSAFLVKQLSEGSRDNLMRSYFGKTGIEYNVIRTPIGGTDYSLRAYTYNTYPENDNKLSNFSLQMEDLEYKIPLIQRAKELATSKVFLLAAAWGPPPWMKTNKKFGGHGILRRKYYQTWADYHIKFLEEYKKRGLTYWAITLGNEPINGFQGFEDTNSLGWGMKNYVYWLGNYFGPTIRNSKYSYIKILVIDDNKYYIPWAIDMIANDERASKYFDGVSLHWYSDFYTPVSLVADVCNSYPDKLLIMAEASYGSASWMKSGLTLGTWSGAETYVSSIIEHLNQQFSSWLDWNLCLDLEGGPSWSSKRVTASIIVDVKNDEFLKQPMFYAVGHFSKFVPRGSIRVNIDLIDGDMKQVGFLRPDGGIVIIFYNPYSNQRHITIYEEGIGYIEFDILGNSFNTILYW